MKLTVGVKSAAEAGYFLDNGAHELYCGLAGLLNNRLPRENLSAPEGAGEIIGLAAARGARVFLAVNEIVPEKLYRPALNWALRGRPSSS